LEYLIVVACVVSMKDKRGEFACESRRLPHLHMIAMSDRHILPVRTEFDALHFGLKVDLVKDGLTRIVD
jgi:hypothetical protein